MKRFLSVFLVTVMVLTMLPVMSFADDFDTENFTGLVLTTTVDNITVQLYNGYSTEAADLMTPVYVDGYDRYYEVTAKGHYLCISKPTSGSARYTQYYNIYISDTEATKKNVMDVTPGVRQTPAPNWEPSIEVRYFAEEVMTQRFPSSQSMWPQYADVFKTPAFTIARNDHQQTTQTEMENYIAGLDDADDNMYVYNLGKSVMGSYNIPIVIFTTADLSGADTLEKAAALVKADNEKNGKLTVHYQAQIHGDETAAGEAALGTITRLDGAYGEGLLDTMSIYVIPRLNPYGSARGKRVTWINSSTYLDPNRDFMRLETSETQLRMYAYNLFYPEVVIDGHEWQEGITATGMRQVDLMLCSHAMPTFSQEYQDTALELASAAFSQLKKDGINFSWYQDSVGGIGFNTGSSNTAVHGSLHVLVETMGVNQGLQMYERRVAAHTSAQTGIFDYLDANAADVKTVVQSQRATIVEDGKTYEEEDVVLLDVNSSDHPELHINTFAGQKIYQVNMKNGGRQEISTYKAKYYDVIKRTRPAPTAYVLPAGESFTQGVLDLMDKQGISYQFIPADSNVILQQYTGTVDLAELTEEKLVNFPNGAYVFTMNQPYALVLAGFMEPDMTDSKMTDVNNRVTGGTLVQMGKITATDGVFPIYRYIHDLNEDGFIDLAEDTTVPVGLTAVNATVAGGTGKITGLDAEKAYEYKALDAESYTTVSAGATEIADLPVGQYLVRHPAEGNTPAGTAVTLTIGYTMAEYAVYLDSANGNAENDGYTQTTAVATFTQAQAQLDKLMAYAPENTTGKIVIVGTYEIATTSRYYTLPAHSYPLLVTGGTLKFTNTNSNSSKWLCIGGETTFDNISLQLGATGSYQFIAGNGHKLTIGENVTSLPFNTTYFGIQGGLGKYDSSQSVASTDLTVKSGYWQSIYGGGYTSGVTGDVKVVVSGANVSRVAAGHNGTIGGNVYIEIENTNVRTEVVAGSTQAGKNVGGDVTLVLKQGITGINDGIFAAGDTGHTAGKVTVIADGIDLTAKKIYGKGNGTGTFGSLELDLRQGQLADVAETFLTQDGISVKLGSNQTKAVTVPHDINLNLNGYDVAMMDLNGNDVVCTGTGNVVCKDSATDDYDVSDDVYGTITGGNVQAAEGYLAVTESGKTSFHKYELEMVNLVVKPSKQGITYESHFRGDEKVKAQIKEFGVAMRAYNAPNATSIWADPECLTHVALDRTYWLTGNNDNELKSVYVANIINADLTPTSNQTRSNVKVYGRAYIQLTGGTMLFSNAVGFSLKEAMQYMNTDEIWYKYLTDSNKQALIDFYKKWESVMENWTGIDRIKAGDAIPENYQWASYYSAEDDAFLPKDIFSQQMYVTGFTTGDAECGWVELTDREDTGAFVFKGEYGKCYEIKVPGGAQRVLAIKLASDPTQDAVGKVLDYTGSSLCDKGATESETAFMYTCRNQNEYLLLYTGSSEAVYIGERTIVQETDTTNDQWYIPETVGSISGDCTYGNLTWTAETVLDQLYEPVRQRHPEYITREVIGKDHSGKYDIYAYIYEPEHYETTMFLNGGTHGDEQTAYFALAKVMELIADAKPEDTLLFTLRHKVRFVVIPILNVWSASETHVRTNSGGDDLNRDFADLTQQESKNFIAFFEKYAEDTRILMDFHIAASSKVPVYFNFINHADNAVANYKTTNHMLHRYISLGYAQFDTDLSKVPGSYTKSNKYMEGRVWNSYGIPTITVEYVTSSGHGFPEGTSSAAMTAAVETQMNFIIQNALYFLANPK